MITLHADIELLVLDHITLLSDLKNLCLTSKAWHAVATPRLYRRIVIRLWNREEVTKMVQCFTRGAGLRLCHTRSLTFEDDRPPTGVERPSAPPITERDLLANMILQMFSDHDLVTLRFISNRSLPATFVARLTSDQTQLEHVQLTSSAMESIMYDVRRFRHLRTLDVQVLQARELADALYAAVSFSDTLERLSLGVMTMSSPDTFASMSSWFRRRTPCRSQAYHLPKLKELGLRNVDLKNSCVILSELTDLHALTSLNLSQCKGFEQFFSQLALEANDKRFKLTEMAFNTLMEEHPLERFETSSFESVLFACDALQSLHFAWSESCDISSWVVRTIENIGDSLQSLSLHCDIDFSPYPPLCESEFEAVCVACPNLQQLGYRLEDGVLSESRPDYTSTPHFMVCTSNEVKRNADWRQECMQYLPDLRTLHLREPNNPGHDPGIPGLDFTNPSAASRNYQQFASAFFIYLHSRNWCPKLQALVIGELSTNKKATEPQSYCYVPQHCFVRGFQKDAANRTVTVGVAVTREELMRIEPISDILGFDVNCDWVGGLSGRFHDL